MKHGRYRRLSPAAWASAAILACSWGDPAGGRDAASGPRAESPPATAPAAQSAPVAPAHGFNDAIAWRGLDDGLRIAAAEARPLMLVVHASWCPKCQQLKPSFADRELVSLSREFVMVNLDQDEHPEAERHAPDGAYVPRVLFFAPDGTLDPALHNPRRGRFRYFYMPHDDLVGAMRRALAALDLDHAARS